MLELLLTRPFEKGLVAAAKDLRFLVLDELHTYRGRQGADVALLVRRVREATGDVGPPGRRHLGHARGAGTLVEQQAEIARVASTLFGATVEPTHVIGETLVRASAEPRPDDPAWLAALAGRAADPASAPADAAAIPTDPLVSWIEGTLGLRAGRGHRETPAGPAPHAGRSRRGRLTEGGQVTKALGVGQDAIAVEDERAHARPSAPNMWMCSRVMRITASRTWAKSLGGSAAAGFAVRYSRLASM